MCSCGAARTASEIRNNGYAQFNAAVRVAGSKCLLYLVGGTFRQKRTLGWGGAGKGRVPRSVRGHHEGAPTVRGWG